MEKEQYFRIVELPEHQVLLEKDFDNSEEEDSLLFKITFYVDGIKVVQSMGYSDEETRDNAFFETSDERIQTIIDSTSKMFK